MVCELVKCGEWLYLYLSLRNSGKLSSFGQLLEKIVKKLFFLGGDWGVAGATGAGVAAAWVTGVEAIVAGIFVPIGSEPAAVAATIAALAVFAGG